MKYIQYVNERIRKVLEAQDSIVLFGQNISAGSCLSGLSKGFKDSPRHLVMNTPNIENTQVGVGFGLMLNGVSSIFFMKQQDFLLLGIDHLVNTYNFVRQNKPKASFTIVTVVVDKGYEGIQSSLNNCGDFCSIARIPGYMISNLHDADYIVSKHLVSPGFRIIGVSQRLFNTEIMECVGSAITNINDEIFQYYKGADATIVCFNFSFPQGLKLWSELSSQGIQASLFSVSTALSTDWKCIIQDTAQTRRLVVLDDSKCVNRSCYQLSYAIQKEIRLEHMIMLVKDVRDEYLCPHSEEFAVNHEMVIKILKEKKLFIAEMKNSLPISNILNWDGGRIIPKHIVIETVFGCNA
ncbi:MAG: hypothetical protein NT033_00370, partial [Candidatus Omnitrophica bacterium]|nr:hypothetical protein [Candidatus Omnitrophota bacterium]